MSSRPDLEIGRDRVRYECLTCGSEVDESITGTPWNCPECGTTDRWIEAAVAEVYDGRARAGADR